MICKMHNESSGINRLISLLALMASTRNESVRIFHDARTLCRADTNCGGFTNNRKSVRCGQQTYRALPAVENGGTNDETTLHMRMRSKSIFVGFLHSSRI